MQGNTGKSAAHFELVPQSRPAIRSKILAIRIARNCKKRVGHRGLMRSTENRQHTTGAGRREGAPPLQAQAAAEAAAAAAAVAKAAAVAAAAAACAALALHEIQKG